MSAEENKALARRFLEEVFNEGNLAAIDDLIDPGWVQHDPAMPEEHVGLRVQGS
jgi:predicted SnoaL-like aldol condensation-catalyzing enzyme